MRALGLDPVHDTRETFRALCAAMSRPGTVETVPAPADHAVLATLVDHEVTLASGDEELRAALNREGRLVEADPHGADVLHARGVPEWDVREAEHGSLTEPSGGATVVYRAAVGTGTTVHLQGPGIPGERTVAVDLPREELERLAAARSYPQGVDAVVAGGDRITAVPRSASVEVA
jgi:alpha-D-ribose 1-methylphosphonate 5-triphosphate synthase subunit PhnH